MFFVLWRRFVIIPAGDSEGAAITAQYPLVAETAEVPTAVDCINLRAVFFGLGQHHEHCVTEPSLPEIDKPPMNNKDNDEQIIE